MSTTETDTVTVTSLPYLRSYPLEDIRILSRAQGAEHADGRTVEAYAAVWGQGVRAEVSDHDGHYVEEIDPAAFNKAINDSRPAGSRSGWRVGVFYNHGMTLHGTPSDRFSVPLGSPAEIRAETRGLLTVTRYNNGPLADEILEAIRSGDITGQSFTGRIIRSDPPRSPRGGYRRARSGELQVVRRLELGLREYGPTPFPAYADAAVLGVRSLVAAGLWPGVTLAATPEVLSAQADEAPAAGSETEPAPADTPTDQADAVRADAEPDGAVTDEPPSEQEEHSSRSVLLRRIAAAKTTRPGLARDPDREATRARAAAITRPKGGSE